MRRFYCAWSPFINRAGKGKKCAQSLLLAARLLYPQDGNDDNARPHHLKCFDLSARTVFEQVKTRMKKAHLLSCLAVISVRAFIFHMQRKL